jgi:hypothetical protein
MGRREVGEAPDRRAPPVGVRVREGEVEWAGGGCWVGSGSCGPAEKKEKGDGVGCWAGKKDGDGLVLFFFLFFFNLLLIKSFQVFKNYFKTFDSHNQTKAHAFNMMHKHLGIF